MSAMCRKRLEASRAIALSSSAVDTIAGVADAAEMFKTAADTQVRCAHCMYAFIRQAADDQYCSVSGQ